MSNVSLMSTASWALGWPSIVEYQDKKYIGSDHKKNKKKDYRLGRVDLYMSNGEKEFICEAKLYFSLAGNLDTKDFSEQAATAFKDVRNSAKSGKETFFPGYSVVFIAHLASRKTLIEDYKSKIRDQVRDMFKGVSEIRNLGTIEEAESLKIIWLWSWVSRRTDRGLDSER